MLVTPERWCGELQSDERCIWDLVIWRRGYEKLLAHYYIEAMW
jgi:hypothetical protein